MIKKYNGAGNFIFSPANFLVAFDVYDREETLGEELNRYNPNKLEDLKELFDQYYFSTSSDLSTEFKIQEFQALTIALKDSEYDFSSLIPSGSNWGSIDLPSKWKIESPRQFFRNIYDIVRVHWEKDFLISGYIPLEFTESD